MVEKQIRYRKQILKQLYFANTLSCSDLSEQIQKSLPLTTKILNELIEDGQVEETGLAASTGGRRAVTYRIKPNTMYIVAVAMDQLVTRIAVMDIDNHPIMPVEKFELPLYQATEGLPILTQKIAAEIKKSNIGPSKIIGIGIGMPGFVDAAKGINYSFLGADGQNITDYISNETGLPVFIDNDSSLVALAELRFGAAKKSNDAMVINISWGVGLGMVLNGQLFRGNNGFAGEFSHIPLFINNKLCVCGKRGCLQTEASLSLVVEKAIEGLKTKGVSLLKNLPSDHYEQAYEAIVDAVAKGDKFSIELFSEAGYNIGRGLAILIHLLNPELIILSGRGSSAGKIWLPTIQQALNEHCIPRLSMNTELEISQLGYDAELIGAAALVMENFEGDKMTTEVPIAMRKMAKV
jgi:predicted NBD/HSP70 family sugar kinase